MGTAALTTRGFNENAFAEVGEIIADRLLNPNDSQIESQCKERVLILCKDEEFGKKFDKSVFPGTQGGPLEHIIAAKAVAFGEALQPDFVNYSQQVIKNAKVLASTLINRGINIVSGGTDNHIVLLDLRSINMTGKIADLLVSEVNITANKNTVPFDPKSPFVTSGLRLGTAALTTRGFNENAFAEVGEIIADRLLNPDDSLICLLYTSPSPRD